MDKFSQSSISSNIMELVYKYDKPFGTVLSDLNKLKEDPDILDPIVVLDKYYKDKQNECENE